MKTRLLALSALVALSVPALADAVADRKQAMRAIGGQARELQPFARGEKAYDAAAVMAALQALDAGVKAFDVDVLFAPGTEAGDTKASPKIWEDRDGFKAAVAAFAEDIGTAISANPQDAAALEPLFGAIRENCSTCHGAWRM